MKTKFNAISHSDKAWKAEKEEVPRPFKSFCAGFICCCRWKRNMLSLIPQTETLWAGSNSAVNTIKSWSTEVFIFWKQIFAVSNICEIWVCMYFDPLVLQTVIQIGQQLDRSHLRLSPRRGPFDNSQKLIICLWTIWNVCSQVIFSNSKQLFWQVFTSCLRLTLYLKS